MIDNYMLYSNLPSLDLHGETRFSSIVMLREFINNNKKLSNKLIIVIHGIGKGILKETIHQELKNNKYVKAYKQDIFNKGVTIIELNYHLH